MSLTFTELEAVTNSYFAANNKKAVDIYFDDSFLADRWLKGKKGLFLRPPGGKNIRVPLSYDGQEGGFYSRADVLSSDDRESINAAYFNWKHAYGNATVYRTDELENANVYAEVELVNSKLEGAQKTIRKWIAQNFYAANGDSSALITGLRSMCSESAGVAYGHIAENDLVSNDGTKPWEGKTNTTEEAISLPVIRTLRSDAKIGNGAQGKPNLVTMPEDLFNVIKGILETQKRYVDDPDTAKAGFVHVVFEGAILAADDYCPSGYAAAINEAHAGVAIHSQGFFVRTPWANLLAAGIAARSTKILFDGNMICNNRKAHKMHSNLT